jgi:hypothetical protein
MDSKQQFRSGKPVTQSSHKIAGSRRRHARAALLRALSFTPY